MYELYCQIRDSKGYKDSDVARGANVAKSTLSDWKNGRSIPGTDKLIRICQFLGVSVEYLKTGKESVNIERAQIDIQLARQQKRIKEYMLKFANLSEEKRNQIMSLIDMLEDK